MAPTFAYWRTRALGHSIKLLLEYTGTEYEEKNYPVGNAPDFDKSEWFAAKFNLGLDFPNLPYFIDGDLKLSQSLAIMRHIARKHDMCGQTDEEKAKVDMLEQQQNDIRWAFYDTTYPSHFESKKEEFVEYCRKAMKQFSDFLGENTWFVGNSMTYVDLLIFDLMGVLLFLANDLLDEHPNLKSFMNKIENIESISNYLKSHRSTAQPLNNKYAAFGSKVM